MTKQLRKAIEIISRAIKPKKKILEVGSWQEKNQEEMADMRTLFDESEYLGIDMRPGTGVDRVINAEELPFADKSFDVVLCLEVLEHAEKPWVVADEIQRVVKNNGIVVASSLQSFPIHAYPSDYFRYTPFGMASLFNQLKSRLVFTIDVPFDDKVKLNPEHVVIIGTKSKQDELMKKIRRALRKNEKEISIHKPYRQRVKDAIGFMKRAWWEGHHRLRIEFF